MEPESHPGEQPDLGVCALDQRVRQVVPEGRVDRCPVGGDPAGEADERRDAAAPSPRQPAVQGLLAFLALDGEHVAQPFFGETIVISAARVEGILNLTVDGIDLEESAILLDEKNNSRIWQPVPPSFCAKLHQFALSRGAVHAGDRAFVKRVIGRRAAKPIDDRRFDYIFNDRLQPSFAWADKTQVTAHTCRHSAVRLVERSFGKAVGQAFARHKPKNVTDIYAKASQREVAAAAESLSPAVR